MWRNEIDAIFFSQLLIRGILELIIPGELHVSLELLHGVLHPARDAI